MTAARLLLGVVAAALVGCSTAEPGAPAPSAPTTTTRAPLEIPAVDAPLEPGPLATDPCVLFGGAERAALGVAKATPTDEAGGPACELSAEGAPPGEFLTVKLSSGLARVSAQCGSSSSAQCDTWSVETIAGYPAVLANGALESKYGSCKLLLGISESSSVLLADVRSTPADGPDCVRATTAATLVVAALQRLGPG